MADINYGLGDGSEDGTYTTTDYLYTVYDAANTPATFDGAGNVDTIKIWNNTDDGRLRVWAGTWSGESFVFDGYDPKADIDLTGKGTGWITLTAPGDFTVFAVTAATGLCFYSDSTTDCLWAKYTGGGDQFYGYSSADPDYSANVAMRDGTTGRLEIKVEGTFPVTYKLEGVTKDNGGSALGTCECFLMKDNQDDTATFVDYDQSDGSGNYSFTGIADNDAQYFVISWKDDTPHVFDVTDHTLTPVEE